MTDNQPTRSSHIRSLEDVIHVLSRDVVERIAVVETRLDSLQAELSEWKRAESASAERRGEVWRWAVGALITAGSIIAGIVNGLFNIHNMKR